MSLSIQDKREIKRAVSFVAKVGLTVGTVAVAIGTIPIPHGQHFAKEASKHLGHVCRDLDEWAEK